MSKFSVRNHLQQWVTVDLNYLNEDKKNSLQRREGPDAHYKPLKVEARITDYYEGSYRQHDNPYALVEFAEPVRLLRGGELQLLTEMRVEPGAISAQWKNYPTPSYDDYHRVYGGRHEALSTPAAENAAPLPIAATPDFSDLERRIKERSKRSALEMFGRMSSK